MLLACIFSQTAELCVCVCIGFPPVFPIPVCTAQFLISFPFSLSFSINICNLQPKQNSYQRTDRMDESENEESILRYNSFGKKGEKSFQSSGGLPGFSVLLFVSISHSNMSPFASQPGKLFELVNLQYYTF